MVNLHLQQAILQVIENQLRANDPQRLGRPLAVFSPPATQGKMPLTLQRYLRIL
ncbi:hypothetical protein HKBW3C_02909, partial [Candidatus Hakubella thermalkaliphila]